MNLTPFVAWAIMGIVGYLIGGTDGALYGLLAGLSLSLLASVVK